MMNRLVLLMISILLVLLISCDSKFEKADTVSINAGDLTIYCEESIAKVMDSTFKMYQNAYPNIKFVSQIVDSREAMNLILSGQAEAVIVSRAYLPDEDSLMAEFDVKRTEMIAAEDALVFYVNRDFPLDTINHEQLVEILTTQKSFNEFYPQVGFEPEFVCNSIRSAEYANFLKLVLGNQKHTKQMKFLNGVDSVKNYIRGNSKAIGIGYLSHVTRKADWKVLNVSYINQDGKREPPQTVHQAYIVQNRYPYIVQYRVLIQESTMSKAFWFASFVSKEFIVQTYFKELGIVPGFGQFRLIKQD
ncbi:MAG: substrate-binding domain-containing protein [Candidatus Kapabacteria bacterium]|nr:substrate-binding domain-containing protein [Candidatus Kapabacteria bacterium]